jgi:hypothetical protein
MSHSLNSQRGQSTECRSCGTPIPPSDPILVKFRRCFYCGRHRPHGNNWTLTTVPVMILAVIGLLAIWWTHSAS